MSTSPPGLQPHHGRLGGIDALRGIAAFSVVLYHLTLIPQPNLILPQWASRYVMSGGMGVTLFFVVSAFCLCLSMRMHEQEPSPVRHFYLRRIFRIVPLFYVWVIVTLVRDRLLFKSTHSFPEVLLSLFFGFNFFPGKHEGFVWAGWTLGVEMVFYLFFPLIYRYVNNWWKSISFAVFTVLLWEGFSSLTGHLAIPEAVRKSFVHFSLLRQLPAFAVGILTFFLYERFIQGGLRSRKWAVLLTGTALAGYNLILTDRLFFLRDVIFLQAMIFGTLLLGLTIVPLGLFVNRVTRFLGEISYSLYLNHPTLVLLLIPAYRIVYGVQSRASIQFGVCMLLTLGLLTVISFGSYRFIEQPGIRLGSRLIRLVGRR
jgi:peptidoglycan/LPS O-acetylase OafA/YrhL